MSRDTKFLSVVCVFVTHLVLDVTGTTWHEYEGHCYATLYGMNNYSSSKFSCLQYGSYVLELSSTPELQFVQSLVSGSSNQFWVGLEYNNITESYYWDRDGQEPMSSLWLSGEPNHSGYCVRLATESQLGISGETEFLLGDQSCSTSNRVICEKDADMLEDVYYRDITVSSSNRCPTTAYLSRSKIHCARNCSKNKSCIGFQYSDSNQFCTPYKFSVTCETSLSPTFSLYVRQYARC